MIFMKYSFLFVFLASFLFSSDDKISEKELLEYKDPDLAWKLSIIPGLGQVYNEKYLKGSLIFLSELSLVNNISIYSTDIAMRNRLIWLSIGLYVYNIIDAYIDAELNTFDKIDKE